MVASLLVESHQRTDDGSERSVLKTFCKTSLFSLLKFMLTLMEMDVLKQAVIQSVGGRQELGRSYGVT